MIRVSQEDQDVLIRLPADALAPEALIRVLDLINHEIRRPNSVVLASEQQPAPAPKRTPRRRRKTRPIQLDQLELPFVRAS